MGSWVFHGIEINNIPIFIPLLYLYTCISSQKRPQVANIILLSSILSAHWLYEEDDAEWNKSKVTQQDSMTEYLNPALPGPDAVLEPLLHTGSLQTEVK